MGEVYEEYANKYAERIRLDNHKHRTECSKYELQLGRYSQQHTELIISMANPKIDDKAREILQTERERIEEVMETLSQEKNKLEKKHRNRLLEFEAFIKVLQEAGARFRKLSYV